MQMTSMWIKTHETECWEFQIQTNSPIRTGYLKEGSTDIQIQISRKIINQYKKDCKLLQFNHETNAENFKFKQILQSDYLKDREYYLCIISDYDI